MDISSIIGALITGGLALAGVIITNVMSNRKIEQQLATQQAVTDVKIDELTREVREHNGFAQKIPLMQEQLNNLKERLDRIEKGGN